MRLKGGSDLRDGFTRERLFLMELPGILYDLHQEVLRGNNNALFQVLQKRLLAVIGGKLSFFLSVEEEVEERLELKPDQICFLEGILGPSQELTKLAEGVKAELSGLLEYDLWKKQTIREPHSVFFDAERLQTDPILSRLRSLGVEACIRIPLMLKRKEGEPNDTIGFIIVVMDILDQDSQRISTMIADVSTAAENLIFTIELQRTYEEARAASYLGIVDFLISALDQNDPFIRGHSRRVSDICLKMLDSEKWEAKSPALGNEERRNLRMAAELHDVGKLEIPLRIAFKPGRLTQDEEQKFELHSTQGANFARKVGLGERVCLGIRYHHKAFDGSDYPPDGRKEGEIPILARIIRVACAFDNAYSEKCYRIRKEDGFGFLWDLETARKEVEKLRDDKKLDPDIVEALLDVYKNEPDDEEEYIKLIKEGNRIAKGEDMGAARDALRCYEKALQAAPENLSLYMFLAHFASEKLGDLNQAIAYCEQAIEKDATSARAHYEHAR